MVQFKFFKPSFRAIFDSRIGPVNEGFTERHSLSSGGDEDVSVGEEDETNRNREVHDRKINEISACYRSPAWVYC